MKKFFFVIGMVLFSACFLVACKSSLKVRVEANISEESRVLFSGQNQEFYATLTSGLREEPYKFDGISNKKVEFSVVSLTFAKKTNLRVIEFEIAVDNKKSQHIAELNLVTNQYMFDLERKTSPSAQITIEALGTSAQLSNKSNEFAVSYEKALEIGTENLLEEFEQILAQKNARFEVFLKLASNPASFDDVFVWYYILKSNCDISGVLVIHTTDPNNVSKL